MEEVKKIIRKSTPNNFFKLDPPNQGLTHGSPKRGPPVCIMQPGATYLY